MWNLYSRGRLRLSSNLQHRRQRRSRKKRDYSKIGINGVEAGQTLEHSYRLQDTHARTSQVTRTHTQQQQLVLIHQSIASPHHTTPLCRRRRCRRCRHSESSFTSSFYFYFCWKWKTYTSWIINLHKRHHFPVFDDAFAYAAAAAAADVNFQTLFCSLSLVDPRTCTVCTTMTTMMMMMMIHAEPSMTSPPPPPPPLFFCIF